MSDVSADLRIFPNKEMFSVDMAEVLDAAILKDGIIQGCSISITNGVLNITAGRIVVSGRLGVITAGSIPIPTLSSQQTCSVVAVCDLRASANPFYVAIVDADGLQTLNSAKSSGDGFNVEGTLDYVVLGTVVVNPVTGLVSDWTPSADAATAHKGKKVYQELLTLLNDKITWKLVEDKDYKATDANPWVVIPTGAKEVFVSVFIEWTSSQKVCVDFHIPVAPHMFNPYPGSASTSHVNYWSKGYNGFVRVSTMTRDGVYALRLIEAYNKETNVLNSTYYRVYYR